MKIIHIKNIFPQTTTSRFNLAAWQRVGHDSLYFIGREVETPGTQGEPDTGMLKLFEMDEDGNILQERAIWQPFFDGINLEDPRAIEPNNENLVIGLTAVLRDKNGKPTPFPAIVKINSHTKWDHDLPPFLVITSFGPGKNLTPIDTTTYLFRPELAEYNHKLLVFSIHQQIPEKISDIQFPTDLPWATWRIGTTMPPLWLNPNEALFIIHGISIQNIDGKDKYIYSIGRAKLTRKENHYQVTIAPDPIITPNTFLNTDGTPMVEELHPQLRRVVYSCGGLIRQRNTDILSLYVNVGDRATYEVQLSLKELKSGLF